MTEITNRDLQREIEAARSLMEEVKNLAGEEHAQAIADTFEGETTLDTAIERTLSANLEDEIIVAGLRAKIDDLSEREKRYKRRIETRVGLIEQAMITAEWTKKKFSLATLSIAKVPASLVVDEESLIPAKFWKRSDPQIDKASLKAEAVPFAKEEQEALDIKDPAARASALQALLSKFPSNPSRDLMITKMSEINDPEILAAELSRIIRLWPAIPGCHVETGGRALRMIRK